MSLLSFTLAFALVATVAPAQSLPGLAPPKGGHIISPPGGRDTPPVILKPPGDQDVQPGARVVFVVEVAGIPQPLFQWRLNGHVLPGETNQILLLPKVEVSDSGAYSVTVWNRAGVVTSPAAYLRVRSGEIIAAADQFKNRTTYRVARATVQGTSTAATVDPDEVLPVGGGKTVWFEWIAPADGIATFSTRGSSFDTILTVFTGSTPSASSRVAQDDDSGGRYTSEVEFNARKNGVYQIQLAGFDYNGVGGPFTLAWSLEETAQVVPIFRLLPQSQGVRKGETATFRALSGLSTDTYQWYFKGEPIPGATSTTLTIRDANEKDVGQYYVIIRNKTRFRKSPPFGLQLALHDAADKFDNFRALLHDKFQYVTYSSANGNRPGAGWISIGLGETIGKLAYSGSDAQQGDPSPCNAPLYGTVFQGLHAEDNGIIRVDTMGSGTMARMAVYLGAVGLGEVLVACDLTNGPAGFPCVVNFPATANSNYTVVVESYESAGNLSVTCQMGAAPLPPSNPLVCAIPQGGSIQLQAPGTNWNPLPTRQWLLNDAPLAGQTGASLQITGFETANVGIYRVVLSNFISVVTNTVANLSLAGPFLLQPCWTNLSGQSLFILQASNAAAFVVETTTNLAVDWVPIATNKDPCLMLTLTNSSPMLDARRFFRAVPWP